MIAIVYKILFFLFESKLQFFKTDENRFFEILLNLKHLIHTLQENGFQIFMYFFFLQFRSKCTTIVCRRKHEFQMYIRKSSPVIIVYLFDIFHPFFISSCLIYKSCFDFAIKYDICIIDVCR